MTSIGDTLRRERQRRNLDIARVSDELKISARFLEAMERDDFGKLPGGVFTKSFVRQYAAFLGLDSEELVAEMERAVEPEAAGSHFSDKPKPDVPGIALDGGANWQSVGDRGITLPSWVRAGALLIGLMVVCSGVYWWWQRPRHPVQARATPTAPVAQTTPPPVPTLAVQTPPATAPQPQVAAPVAESKPESTPPPAASAPTAAADPKPNPNASVHVGITADEEVWVRIAVNGQAQFSGTLEPKQTRNVDADGEVTLRLGNAGGVTITLNGKPIGPVGPKGQIRTVSFTANGFQVVAPPKPDSPDHF